MTGEENQNHGDAGMDSVVRDMAALRDELGPMMLRATAADVLRRRSRRRAARGVGAVAFVALCVGGTWMVSGWTGGVQPVGGGPEIVTPVKPDRPVWPIVAPAPVVAESSRVWVLAQSKGDVEMGERGFEKMEFAGTGRWVKTGAGEAAIKYEGGVGVELSQATRVRLGEGKGRSEATAEGVLESGTIRVTTSGDQRMVIQAGTVRVEVEPGSSCEVERGEQGRVWVRTEAGWARVRGAKVESRLFASMQCGVGGDGEPMLPASQVAMKSPFGSALRAVDVAFTGKSKLSVEDAVAACAGLAGKEDAAAFWNIMARTTGEARRTAWLAVMRLLGDEKAANAVAEPLDEAAMEKVWEMIVTRR